MNYEPLSWYEQEYLRCKAHFEALPKATFSLRPASLKVSSQRYCLKVIQGGTPVHRTRSKYITLISHYNLNHQFAFNITQHKENLHMSV